MTAIQAHYEKAVSLDPEKPAFLQSLADFYVVEQNRTEDALQIYLRILETDPSNIDLLSITGNLLAVNGKPDAARGYYLRILEIEPGNQNARENLDFLTRIERGNSRLRDVETERRQGTPSPDFRVVAIISAHNEGDVIYHVIGDLIRQGVSVYLLDHQSTDDTVEIAAKWLGKGLLHIEKFPEDAHYAEENRFQYIWRDILKRKSELASQLEADWFIHADADEFRESPWPGLTLKEAIQVVDRLGYNAIDFELLNFRPVDNSFVPSEDVREYLKYYEGAENYNSRQVKAWKNLHVPIDLVTSGGHDVAFDGRTVFPIRFILRHYPIRSQQHGLLKVFHHRKNRFSAVERAMSWHVQYDQVRDESHDFIRRAEELRIYDPFEVRLKLLGSDPYGMLSKFQKQTEAGPDPEAQRPCPEQLEAMPPSGQRQRGAHDESEPVAASRGARTLAAEAHEGILKLLISAGKYSEAVFALERLAETYP
ncbi:MAG TPA: glycosyltransferase family 2 protein, partial [Syntrophales bacterium]|nr:glycosyltransferase family 2 protein [Syntrophales bacterium]